MKVSAGSEGTYGLLVQVLLNSLLALLIMEGAGMWRGGSFPLK